MPRLVRAIARSAFVGWGGLERLLACRDRGLEVGRRASAGVPVLQAIPKVREAAGPAGIIRRGGLDRLLERRDRGLEVRGCTALVIPREQRAAQGCRGDRVGREHPPGSSSTASVEGRDRRVEIGRGPATFIAPSQGKPQPAEPRGPVRVVGRGGVDRFLVGRDGRVQVRGHRHGRRIGVAIRAPRLVR